MENNWIKVYTTENAITAEIIKQALVENDIPAVVLNQQDSSYRVFGVVTVLVRPEDLEKAETFIKENEF